MAAAYLYGRVTIEGGVVSLRTFSISPHDSSHQDPESVFVCLRKTQAVSYPAAFTSIREHALSLSPYSRYWRLISDQLQQLPIPVMDDRGRVITRKS